MSSKLYTSKKKNARIQTPDVSTAPASGIFEPRPFVPQQEATQQSQPDINTALTQTQRYGHNLSQVNFAEPSVSTPTHPKTRLGNPLQLQKVPAAPLQAKLAIGKPGDKYEQEADRVAEQVVSNLHAPTSEQSNQSQNLQREAVPEEDKLQRQPEASVVQREKMPEEQDKLQMKPSAPLQDNEGRLPTSNLEASIQKARGSGQALSDDIRTPMEQAFGADFSGVKVHTNAQSHQSNQSIQAKAFTTGHDIFFRQGAYNPHSQQGQQLLAHELTHVVQQNTGVVQRSPSEERRKKPGNTPTTPPQQSSSGSSKINTIAPAKKTPSTPASHPATTTAHTLKTPAHQKTPGTNTEPTTLDKLYPQLSPAAREAFNQQKELLGEASFQGMMNSQKKDGTYNIDQSNQFLESKRLNPEQYQERLNKRAQSAEDKLKKSKAIEKIINICEDTDGTNRPTATVGDGTSEAALQHEIKTGKPFVSAEGHYLKIAQSIRTLTDLIQKLENFKRFIIDSSRLKEIDQAIARARKRLDKMKPALKQWNERASTYPNVWHLDGTSKVQPGWPSKPDPL